MRNERCEGVKLMQLVSGGAHVSCRLQLRPSHVSYNKFNFEGLKMIVIFSKLLFIGY